MSSHSLSEAHNVAMAKSSSNQEGGITIPPDQLDQIVEIQLGFQPLGVCCARPFGSDEVAIACYFEPAVCLTNVERNKKGMHFAVSHIRGVNHGIQSVRLFPDIYQAGGANRAQCVLHGFGGALWVSRNGERDFYILSRPDRPDGRWTLTAKLPLPPNNGMGTLHAAARMDSWLVTVESRADLTDWRLCQYDVSTGDFKVENDSLVPDWTYGIGFHSNKLPWTITDIRCTDRAHGIYYNDKLVVPKVCGTGLTFLSDGSALVTRYGQSYPGCFNGIQGALIYVPAAMLKAE